MRPLRTIIVQRSCSCADAPRGNRSNIVITFAVQILSLRPSYGSGVNISERPHGSEAVVRFICLSNIVISILNTAVKTKL